MQRILKSAFCAALLSSPVVQAQSLHASSVVSFNQGSGGGIFTTSNILGGPQGGGFGGGSLDVLTLGEAGDVTLGFDVTITNGPGADLTVFENGFAIGGGPTVFSEILYVEVSTDGVNFARFEPRYTGSGTAMGSLAGLAGGMPVVANVGTNLVSPFDPVVSGGESFDLIDLIGNPLVTAGLVDLAAIHFVRLVDVAPGDVDVNGTPLPGNGGSDVDAVTVLNSDLDDFSTKPICDLSMTAGGRIKLTIGDPQGFGDLDFSTLHASMDLADVPLAALLPLFTVVSATPTQVELLSPPVAGSGFVTAFSISIADAAGVRSGDQFMVQG